MSIRKALGAVKDQTSISIAKVTGDLDVAVIRATSHEASPADPRHVAQVLRLTFSSSSSSSSRAHVVASLARRLARTRDYVVAAKCLVLVHRLVAADADPPHLFRHEVLRPAPAGKRAGEPLLALLADFRDEAHAASWEHSAFVRAYAAYLDARVRFLVSLLPPPPRAVHFADDPLFSSSLPRRPPNSTTLSVHEMDPESLLTRSRQLRHLLDRTLACRPSGTARNSRVVLAAIYPVLKDSFQLYTDVSAVLAVLLDRFFEMDYGHCVKAFEAYVAAAKQIDELRAFHAWCADVGVARAAVDDFPAGEVNRIDDSLLETLEQFLRERGRAAAQNQSQMSQAEATAHGKRVQDDHRYAPAGYDDDMNSVKALPAPPPESSKATAATAQEKKPDQLVDLREPVSASADDKLALALFNAPAPPTNGDWVAFPSDDDDDKVITSAWQTPAAEPGKADWELALVETASNLSRQKAALGGGLDPLLLGGMYDHGAVRHHHVAAQAASGSASSVAAFPGRTGSGAPVLALPAPDGTVQTVGGGDPFAASLAVPPPPYVQMAEMERKQELLVQEQHMWAQYRQNGMQGQPTGLAAGSVFASSNTSVAPMMMPPYGMAAYNHVAGYY